MVRFGITGQSGFVGTHLFNYLNLQENVTCIPFNNIFFDDPETLGGFVKQCDVIIHLAALNRHIDADILYQTNVDLVQKLIAALESEGVNPHVIFSSSTQEERNNAYGNSKKYGRSLLIDWAKKNNAKFTGLLIPNVFGPFGNPYYNSVMATFCHQLTHNENPAIDIDGTLNLIYVAELVEVIWNVIKEKIDNINYIIPATAIKKVTEILTILLRFKSEYYDQGIFPKLNDSFELNCFNTFRSYIDHETFFPYYLSQHIDDRGSFVETIKLHQGGQVSFSTTKPQITRGNHFHTRKIERFAVIKGKARIDLRRIGTDKILSFELDGEKPSYVDMPIWYTHNITNIGTEELYTIFWINEFFDPADTDTFFVEV